MGSSFPWLYQLPMLAFAPVLILLSWKWLTRMIPIVPSDVSISTVQQPQYSLVCIVCPSPGTSKDLIYLLHVHFRLWAHVCAVIDWNKQVLSPVFLFQIDKLSVCRWNSHTQCPNMWPCFSYCYSRSHWPNPHNTPCDILVILGIDDAAC